MFLMLVLLALVQGLTEFLPISSSGHLIILWESSEALGLATQEELTKNTQLVLDVAVHMGTLGAVILYFWRDVFAMIKGLYQLARGRSGPDSRLMLAVVVASIPLVIVGFFTKDLITQYLRVTQVIAWSTIIFGLLLWVADRYMLQVRKIENLDWPDFVSIGLLQVLALIPGTSRSGITMTAGRFQGMERGESARFSMLLSIPAISGAGLLAMVDLMQAHNAALTTAAFWGAGLSFAFALIAIWWLMRWLRTASFTVFVIYRVFMGLLILAIVTF